MNRAEQARIAGKVYKDYCEGDFTNDADLAVAVRHFRALSDMLLPMGATFRLAATECTRVLIGLEGFQQSRKDDRKIGFTDMFDDE